MLALRDWQQQLQHAILAGDASAQLLHSVRRQGVIAQQRIGIYQDAYHLRLAEALASNYPAIARYLGEADFSALARAFATSHPSLHASIRWFGDSLGAFLHTQSPWSSNPVLHELARFEWALRHTVDAADRPVLTVDALRALPAERWPGLLLTLQPAATTPASGLEHARFLELSGRTTGCAGTAILPAALAGLSTPGFHGDVAKCGG